MMRWLLRPVCWLLGHDWALTVEAGRYQWRCRLCGLWDSQDVEIPKPRLNIDKLAEAMRPFPPESIAALWFVDEPAEYYTLLRYMSSETFMGVPVYQFISAAYSEDEMGRTAAFCDVPGLWLEMENGNYRKLEDWHGD